VFQKSIYGTAYSGGSCSETCGTIFRVTGGKNLELVHAFSGGSDGANPKGGLTEFNGGLYGTTCGGGANGFGTVYSLLGSESVLYAFKGGSHDGACPVGNLVVFEGALYGVTQVGGENNAGTIFRVDASGNEKVLHSFVGAYDGKLPTGLLVFHGALFGTAAEYGPNNRGTLFRITSGGTFNVVHSFRGYQKGDGAYPEAPPIFVRGKLWGTTKGGGAHGDGTIYESSTGGAEAVMYSFGHSPDGVHPFAPLVYINNVLYGTTLNGGKNGALGTVFSLFPF
jgi:uncharacterized repeat protein (TIGR03803 family)